MPLLPLGGPPRCLPLSLPPFPSFESRQSYELLRLGFPQEGQHLWSRPLVEQSADRRSPGVVSTHMLSRHSSIALPLHRPGIAPDNKMTAGLTLAATAPPADVERDLSKPLAQEGARGGVAEEELVVSTGQCLPFAPEVFSEPITSGSFVSIG